MYFTMKLKVSFALYWASEATVQFFVMVGCMVALI